MPDHAILEARERSALSRVVPCEKQACAERRAAAHSACISVRRAAGDSTFACRRDHQLAVAHAKVLAVYAPFGDRRPFFRARVNGQEAARQPAEQGLVQVEQIKVEQVRLQQVEMTQQQIAQQQAGPSLSLWRQDAFCEKTWRATTSVVIL